MRIIYALIISLLLSLSGYGQDPHFSQFFASPLTLNPALTGRFSGNLRIAGNYRNQWPTISRAFITTSISADFPILTNQISEIDRFAVGIMGYADEQADGVLKNSFYSFSTAYHKGLDEDGYHSVTIGFQGTFAQKKLNTAELKFEDQLRADGFTGITSEIFDPRLLNIRYFDVNAGLMFNGVFENDLNYYLGGSMYHINRPKESFRGADFILRPRYTFHGGMYVPISANATLHTSALYQNQSSASETVIGGAVGWNINDPEDYNSTVFYAGSWYRVKDAIIPYVGLEFGAFRLGATYDVNISKLRTASNSRGGFEISLIYIGQKNQDNFLNCPKF